MVDFKYTIGPKRGKCIECGCEIEPYDSHWIDRNTGAMVCVFRRIKNGKENYKVELSECDIAYIGKFLHEHGFHYYTDG